MKLFSPSSFRSLLLAGSVIGCVTLSGITTAFAQRDLTEIPSVDPEVERQSFVMSDGLQANLFADDSKIAKPIQMNFDAKGRLWVVGSEVYPHIKPGEVANDKILILEDIDRDGVAETSTVFADGLLIPTGVLPDERGGCYVANSTELIYLQDTDGDGKADRRQIVLSGFGTEDTHHLLHTLRWAPDGSLFMNQSIYIHSHIETPFGVRHMNGGGLWRFRPDTLNLETYCLGFVNPWGTAFDRWGQSFATDGAYGEGINYVFPGSVFVTSPGARRIMSGLNPGSPKHCGLEIISGRHFPADWQGNMVTNDFRANRVCRFVVDPQAAGYRSRQETEIIRSTHMAFRPIDAKMGPDGALYIADWYNPIIQHGEVDFRDPRRDHVHGRVWRVTMPGRDLAPVIDFTAMNAPQLIQQLQSPEAESRLWAKRCLRNLDRAQVLSALQTAIDSVNAQINRPDTQSQPSESSEADEHFRLELLWAGLNIGHLNQSLLLQMTASQDARVRAAAVRVAVDFLRTSDSALALQLCQTATLDSHPQVRLEAVHGLAKFPVIDAAVSTLRVMDQGVDANIDFALWATLRQLAPQWLPAAQAGTLDYGDDPSRLTFALRALDSADVLGPLFRLLEQESLPGEAAGDPGIARQDGLLLQIASLADPGHLQRAIQWVALQNDAPKQKLRRWAMLAKTSTVVPSEIPAALSPLWDHLEPDASASDAEVRDWLTVAGRWKVFDSREKILDLIRGSGHPRTDAQSPETSDADHADTLRSIPAIAIQALGELGRPASAASDPVATDLSALATDSQLPLSLRGLAVAELATLNLPDACKLATQLCNLNGAQAGLGDWLPGLLSQKDGQSQWRRAIEAAAQEDPQWSLAADFARAAMGQVRASAQPDAELVAALQKFGNLSEAAWSFDNQQMNQFVNEVAQHGDPFAGERIYRRRDLQCTLCHVIGGVGTSIVGPDMISIGASAPVDYIVQSLVDPNAKVKEGYNSKTILTIDGKIVAGIVDQFSDGVYRLRLADGTITQVNQADIDEIADGKSLMPAGLVDTLTRQELIDLTAFLSQLGKADAFSIRSDSIARFWQVLPWTDQANSKLNRTSFDTVAIGDPAIQWQTQLSLVSGQVPLAELPTYQIHANVPVTSFVRTAIDVLQAGPVDLHFNDPADLTLWINDRPTPLPQTKEAGAVVTIDLPTGRHWVTLAIDRQQRKSDLQLQITSATDSPAVIQLPLK